MNATGDTLMQIYPVEHFAQSIDFDFQSMKRRRDLDVFCPVGVPAVKMLGTIDHQRHQEVAGIDNPALKAGMDIHIAKRFIAMTAITREHVHEHHRAKK
jgi:hypothetical protein